ncbi:MULTISPECIES: hypothetical protein [Bacillus]|uniref:hypothetical protein n=1 Tax=Bacillus TaxID=1386 RepID=UPI0005303B3D|nr:MULTISPECIES: hypothetical protein [Bacillus]AIX08015.1 Stress response protein YvgO precursor [Bacillus subtilis]MCY7621940.1 stress protein [Bacillus altitudinis]MDL2028737.1 stress protein [Bacillus subtilis]QIW85310.1 stress protein [Bacillus velezensis]
MKISRKLVGACLALSLTLPIAESASAASKPNEISAPQVSAVVNPLEIAQESNSNFKASGVGGNVNVDFDVLGIADRIANAVKSNQNRGGWVKNVMETAFYAANGNYNVMVFNLNQEYQERFRGVKFYGSAVYDGITYGIWVFEDGSFDNNGDGSWINWAFKGWFDRDNKHVEFHKR